MPGPRNKHKRNTRKKQKPLPATNTDKVMPLPLSPAPSRSPSPAPSTTLPSNTSNTDSMITHKCESEQPSAPLVLPPSPSPSPPHISPVHTTHLRSLPPIQTFLHDPGTGPRVLDMAQFLKSPFALKPSLQDPMCAEFAQEELLEMFLGVLPEELGLMLWYNKSRLGGRVCPTCGRLYRLGDVLPPHAILNACESEKEGRWEVKQSERLTREQELSGLCSPLCFITASCSYPDHVVRSIWGRSAEQVDDATWDAMSGTGYGLDLLVKMTRMQDLGLGQLYFPREDFDGDDEIVH